MRTLFARPTQDWPVLGLQGQKLGSIVRCAFDADTGRLKYLELQTSWQTIHLDWPHLRFDEQLQSFKLTKIGQASGRNPQASGARSESDDWES
jgi:hypothetical protein